MWRRADSSCTLTMENRCVQAGSSSPPALLLLLAHHNHSPICLLPRAVQDWWGPRAIRPAASWWVKARTANVRIHTSRFVVHARPLGERVLLELNDGSERVFDHVLVGTGYQVDIAQYPFLSALV